MCARYNLRLQLAQMNKTLKAISEVDELKPRYNVAPTQLVPTVSLVEGERILVERKWGLIPSWSKTDFAKTAGRRINAVSEEITVKSSYRSAIKKRRDVLLSKVAA